MTMIERAEKLGRGRALAMSVYAAMLVALLLAGLMQRYSAFLHGMWLGLAGTAMIVFLPLGRWLRPNSPLSRLVDDEGTRDHRARAMGAGFWAAVVLGLGLALATEAGLALSAPEVARMIATAAAAVALAGFGVLELRAAR